ncbi:MAG: Ig domain-containing protein, partial [Oscillospiraceae bacterium]|nr:Ig domain-containing protein [Oscillospiraceae bacterium]
MRRTRRLAFLLALCLLVGIFALPVSASAAAKLNKKKLTLNVKQTYALKLSCAKGKVKWSTSDRKVATVTKKGVVKGVAGGTCKITAKNGKKTYTCKVTVIEKVKKVMLDKTLKLTVGGKATLKPVITPVTATNQAVKWTSSNTKVAKVNSNGKVTPIAAGTATITCTSKFDSSKKATFKITVRQYVEKVSLSAGADEIFEGETLQIKSTISPSDSSDKSLVWSSSNTKIATVDSNGKVTGVKSGTATITATAKDRGTISGKYTVDILLPVTGIALDKTSAVIYTNNKNGL